MHDYGLGKNQDLLSEEYWKKKPFKRVILTNAWLAKNRITVDKIVTMLNGIEMIPHWKQRLATWLVEAVVKAQENNQPRADITPMFSCDLITTDGYMIIQQYVQNFIVYRLFNIVSETDEELRVKLTWRSIF